MPHLILPFPPRRARARPFVSTNRYYYHHFFPSTLRHGRGRRRPIPPPAMRYAYLETIYEEDYHYTEDSHEEDDDDDDQHSDHSNRHPPLLQDSSMSVSSNSDDSFHLFEQEESDHVNVQLTDSTSLQLGQYGSTHDQWGIFSCVWDGGIALLGYVMQHHCCDNTKESSSWKNTTIIDIGSGTGIVGIGCSVLSKGDAAVAITDLPEALELLEKNCALNQTAWQSDTQAKPVIETSAVSAPQVIELSWGVPLKDKTRLFKLIGSKSKGTFRRQVIITGADIVYRENLFRPLLQTLAEVEARVLQYYGVDKIQLHCWLACQSKRTHLQVFFATARQYGYQVQLLSLAELPAEDNSKMDLRKIKWITPTNMTVETATIREGLVWIVELRKMPYTFEF